MQKLIHLSLEKYPTRYTWQLSQWYETAMKTHNIDYRVVSGSNLGNNNALVTGSVLDAHSRTFYSLTQMAELVKMMQAGEITSNDVILAEDMYTSGLDALPYIMCQIPAEYRPKIFVRCWAQSFDPDDFIYRTGMFDWMRKYEEMLDQFISGIFVANEELAAYIRVSGIKAPVYVVGLPFDSNEVRSRVTAIKPLHERKRRIVFASRWDDEKQPDFFMDIVEQISQTYNYEFALLTGHKELKSSNPKYVERALALSEKLPEFKVYTGLQKEEYYNIVADSMILLNTALQDWVAFTNLEADALGTMTLSPAYRGMPETFNNNQTHLYIPWSVDSAVTKIVDTMNSIRYNEVDKITKMDIGALSKYSDDTIYRQILCMQGNGGEFSRNELSYRQFVANNKY